MNGGGPVLVVEDDDDDFFLTRRSLKKVTSAPIVHVSSGRAAIDYLAGRGTFGNRAEFPLPAVMLLDLKMDDVSGHQVLEWVSGNLSGAHPKIYVLTGSDEPRDREMVKNSGVASGYIVKPLNPEHLATIFRRETVA
jgi:CheY-like chemotaxis protein